MSTGHIAQVDSCHRGQDKEQDRGQLTQGAVNTGKISVTVALLIGLTAICRSFRVGSCKGTWEKNEADQAEWQYRKLHAPALGPK